MSSDRRDFLKFLFTGAAVGTSMSPIELLIQTAIGQSYNLAHGSQNIQDKFYFNLATHGAPERFTYDLFLDPYGNGKNIVSNGGVNTCYGSTEGSNRYDKAIYKTTKIPKHNIHAPWMWGQKMRSRYGYTPIYELMQNMLVIQGVDTGAPGHSLAINKTEEANNLTLAGLLSDTTFTPLKALNINSQNTFKSGNGNNSTPLSNTLTSNMINTLMSKFNANKITTITSLNNEIHKSFKLAVDNLNHQSANRTPNSLNIKKTYDGANELIFASLGNFQTIWSKNLDKYKKLIHGSTFDRKFFKGFNDKAIGKTTDRDIQYSFDVTQKPIMNGDLRSLIYKQTYERMAPIFAVAEFIADNKLASAINCKIFSPNVQLVSGTSQTPRTFSVRHDQHYLGTMASTLTNALMYRCISSCIYEFKTFLEKDSKGYKFDNSLIRLNGEFNRSPSITGRGSDHGWLAQSTTLFSGMIKAPIIAGRIHKEGSAKALHSAKYKGSWGVGAPININGVNRHLTAGNVISSIATILGIPSPSVNSKSILKLRNGKVALADPKHKLKVVA